MNSYTYADVLRLLQEKHKNKVIVYDPDEVCYHILDKVTTKEIDAAKGKTSSKDDETSSILHDGVWYYYMSQ